MPKHEPFTPKAIGKRIKSKGLQKLKYFCQMCQKQCRDENGFKCHATSEAHQRQLLLFADNPGRYIEGFSGEFLKDFLHLLRTRFGTRRVHANQVYQEYIKDRNHLHMNSTRWVTLTGLVKWMGKKGICTVDNTEKGWFITYIDRDPETLKRQDNLRKKEKSEKDYEERMAKIIAEQIERGKQAEKHHSDSDEEEEEKQVNDEFKRPNEEEKVKFSLKKLLPATSSLSQPSTSSASVTKLESKSVERSSSKSEKRKREINDESKEPKKKLAIEELIEEQEKFKEKNNFRDNWLEENIIVKVTAEKLGEKYYRKKGIVKEIKDKYIGIIEMLDTKDLIKIDQEFLETVIPQVGRLVKVVNGAYVGCTAILTDVNFDKFSCTIKIDSGPLRGRIVDGVKYEYISKLNV